MGLAFRLAVSVGILGILSLFGCAATAPPSEDLATSTPIAVPQALTSPSGAAADSERNALTDPAPKTDSYCPYLTFDVVTGFHGIDPDEARAWKELQKSYMEMFSVQLERVGFKLWEPFGARLERAGFRELGGWWARVSALGVTELTAREAVELEKIHAKFTTHEEERFEQLFNAPDSSTWLVRSSVLDITGSEEIGLPEGDRVLVWHWSMKKQPTVLDGALRMDLFSDPTDYYPNRKFGSIFGHTLVMKSDSEAEAARYADYAATTFLPHARQLCADMSATLLEEEAALERIRDQLTEEIIRVRERRAEQEKRLKLEVEQ